MFSEIFSKYSFNVCSIADFGLKFTNGCFEIISQDFISWFHVVKEIKHHYGTSDEDKSLWLISKCDVNAWARYSLRHVPFFILKPIRIMIKYYRRTVMSFQIRAKSTVKWKGFLKLPKWPSFERPVNLSSDGTSIFLGLV